MVRCAIWYHLYNLKNVKNTHGGVLILVKLQVNAPHIADRSATNWEAQKLDSAIIISLFKLEFCNSFS